MRHLHSDEVREQLRKAIRGEVSVSLVGGAEDWGSAWHCRGDVDFWIGDWWMRIEADTGVGGVQSARAPDGRAAEYDDWGAESAGPGSGEPWNNPTETGMTQAELEKLDGLFWRATARPANAPAPRPGN